MKNAILSILLLSIVVVLIPHLIWLISWLVGRWRKKNIRYAPFGWTALGLEIALLLIMNYGIFIGRFRLQINHEVFRSADVPAELDGYRIVHISDLHLATFDDRPSALQRIVDSINAQQPDLICFTGDMVTIGWEEALPYQNMLRQLHAKDGVFAVLGNHDMLIYRDDWESDSERTEQVDLFARFEQDSLGWHVLRNQHCMVNPYLTLVGVDNCNCTTHGFRTIYAGDLTRAMDSVSGFCILLTHDPSHWRTEVADRLPVPLTLSGHTHAGQVILFGKSFSSFFFDDNMGWYKASQQSVYINQGLGCTLPLRLNCPAEITVITLHSSPDSTQ